MKIRFYANLEKPEAAECAAALSTRARELGLKPVERGAADAVVDEKLLALLLQLCHSPFQIIYFFSK